MSNGFRIFRPGGRDDLMHLRQMREVIKRSRELLAKTPAPNTFIGRKTHEPFPLETGHACRKACFEAEDMQPLEDLSSGWADQKPLLEPSLPDRARTEEARRVVQEYIDDLRKVVGQLRKKMH